MATINLQLVQLVAVFAAVLLFCSRAEPAAVEVEKGSGDTDFFPADLEPEDPMSEELVNEMTGGPSLFQGDIILEGDLLAIIEQGGEPWDPHEPQRAITRRESRRWPEGKVPYHISSSLSSKARRAIEAAVRDYAAHTCIQLYPRESETDYIYFYKGSGCFSSVGRVGGGQRISIGSGCEYKGIVIHEIFHALGRWHEQSRPDRDAYITVKYENMKDGVEVNFNKLSTELVKTQGVTYDYNSVMHYSAYAFSRNGRPTIKPKDRSVRSSSLGQRAGLSNKDIQHANALYCTVEPASWSSWGSWSSCSRTCNGGVHTRYRSCEGGTTCVGSNSQEQTCNTQPCQEQAQWTSWGSWSGCSASCGGGRQARSRQCRNGNTCAGASTQYRSCNTVTCPLTQGTWSSWSSWGPCSASCGGAVQTSSRKCLSEPCEGSSSRQKTCNTQECPTALSGLRHEGCYQVVSGSGLYLLEGSTSDLRGNPFKRTDAVEKCVEAAARFSYSVIGVAAGYCISGNNRLSAYTRSSSSACQEGRGGYEGGVFHMDVYTITNRAVFHDTVQSDETEQQGPPPTSSSSHIRTSTLTFLLIVTLTMLFI